MAGVHQETKNKTLPSRRALGWMRGRDSTGQAPGHSHCYRHDEILMLLNLSDELGFHVQTLQHVLEGYKVAKEIAAHKTGGSTFSDWWAYKLEAFDAIPYNAALMASRGVIVSLNSDSDELARRLYLEAAKAMKYGGVSEEDALRMVTLNPAIQLGIDKRVGSIDVGKDADLVIFSQHPFSVYTMAEMTMIEGEIYFERAEDLKQREVRKREKDDLIKREREQRQGGPRPPRGDKPEVPQPRQVKPTRHTAGGAGWSVERRFAIESGEEFVDWRRMMRPTESFSMAAFICAWG